MKRDFSKRGPNWLGCSGSTAERLGASKTVKSGSRLSYASAKGHAFIDRELYLPKSWTEDRQRCQVAGVPPEVEFATKPQLAMRMVERGFDAGLSASWVTGDSVYGGNWPLRTALEARDQAYALAITCQERVNIDGVLARVDALVPRVEQDAWQRLSAGAGAKGPRFYDWFHFEIESSDTPEWKRWVVLSSIPPRLVILETEPSSSRPTLSLQTAYGSLYITTTVELERTDQQRVWCTFIPESFTCFALAVHTGERVIS
jgi:SRSO17 transposase